MREPSIFDMGRHSMGRQSAERSGARAGDDASWVEPLSRRELRLQEVDDRIAQLGRDIDLAKVRPPPELLTQWNSFRSNWENYMENLSVLGEVMPGAEQEANRQDARVDEFVKLFAQAGVNTAEVKPPPKTVDTGMDLSTKLLITATVATLGLALIFALKSPTVIASPTGA